METGTAVPVASSTPQTYKVARNDTLTSIARRFGVSLEALMAVNPGVNASALQPGQSLNIPSSGEGTNTFVTATPAPAEIGPGFCQPSGWGTVCYVPVHNPATSALQNVSLEVSLLDVYGQSLASQTAVLPLSILGPDQVLPAVVFFDGVNGKVSTPGQVSAQGRMLTAIRLSPEDPHYLDATIQNLLVSTAWDGRSAEAQGKIRLNIGSDPASLLWAVAVAYDETGQIVGARRWEWSGTLQPGDTEPFSVVVYSLGPAIQHVEVLVEARP